MSVHAPQVSELTAYLSRIRHSNLLPSSAGLIKTFVQRVESAEDPVERLGALLVENGLLTSWQHAQLAAGKHEGFYVGSYKLLDFVSKGGLAAHIAAEHAETGERVILKILLPEVAKQGSMLERFQKEVEATQQLDHPNLVRVYDLGTTHYPGIGALNFMITEYFRGATLLERVEEDGPFSAEDAADAISQAAMGLDHAHQRGIVHRNIKPSNLRIDARGGVKLANLGVARFLQETDQESLTLLYQASPLGTIEYMAPEQLKDSHAIDQRSDIYSLGCVLYFLLTGSHRYREGSETARMMRQLEEKPRAIHEFRDDVPPQLSAICERMMSKSPDDRLQTANEVHKALKLFCSKGKIELFDDDQSHAPRRGDTTLLRDLLNAAGDPRSPIEQNGNREQLLAFMRDFGE